MVETTYHIPGAPHLALLADLHGRPYQAVVDSVRRHAPSMVCIAGDILYGSHPEDDRSPLDTQENVLPFLESCTSLAPTFLSLGNHEWMLNEGDLERIRSTGVVVLDNDYQSITVEGQKIVIAGLTSGYVLSYRRFRATQDGTVRYPKKETAERRSQDKHSPDISWLADFCAEDGYKVILSHHPEAWPLIRDYPFSLCLAAHAHGGQWRIFGRGVFAPGQGFCPRWTRGVYEEKRLVVSAGLSNTASIPRLFNPTEVVYLEPL